MKRKAAITAIVLVLLLCFSQFAFAGNLEITSTFPEDGQKGMQPSNLAVKIAFNENMNDTSNDEYNKKLITIKDAEGNVCDFTLVHHDKYENELWCVLVGDSLTADTEYIVNVSSGIKAKSGTILNSSKTFSFKTRNTKTDNTISIVLSIGMMVVMIFVTTKSAQKQAQENANVQKQIANEKLSQANPYKLAKQEGISVDEAKAKISKEQSKIDKKKAANSKAVAKSEAKEAAREAEIQRRLKEIHDASVYKVKKAGSFKEHGYSIPKAVAKKLAAKKKNKK